MKFIRIRTIQIFAYFDSINKPKDLIDRAIALGLSGISITDHESVCVHPEANLYQLEVQKEHPDFKIALGNEIYLTDIRKAGIRYWHFILIARDRIGQRMLRELSSYSWMNSYTDRGLERVPTLKSELKAKIEEYGMGHLIATSACIGGELSGTTLNLVKAERVEDQAAINQFKSQIHQFMLFCIDCFGDDYYVEVAPGRSEEQIAVNRRLVSIAKAYNRKMVIGTDAHYLKKEDRYVHKAYLNSKEGDREVDAFYEYSYLQTDEEIRENLAPSGLDVDELYRNSEEIYNKIENYQLQHSQQIPRVKVKNYPKVVPKQEDQFRKDYPILTSMLESNDIYERYWVNQCIDKLKELNKNNKTYLSRLEEEADIKRVIGGKLNTNMFSYPITLQHYINMFWDCGSMVGAGRGSSCSGLNHYLLGVTQLDPVQWNLPFWRLELLRNSLPA